MADRRDAILTMLRNWLSRLLDHWFQSLQLIPSNMEIPLDRQELHSAHASLLTLADMLNVVGLTLHSHLIVSPDPLYGLGPPDSVNHSSGNTGNAQNNRHNPSTSETSAQNASSSNSQPLARASTTLPVVNPNATSYTSSTAQVPAAVDRIPGTSTFVFRPSIPNSPSATPAAAPSMVASPSHPSHTARALPASIRNPNQAASSVAGGSSSSHSGEGSGWISATGSLASGPGTLISLASGGRTSGPSGQHSELATLSPRASHPAHSSAASSSSSSSIPGTSEITFLPYVPGKKRGRPPANPALAEVVRGTNVKLHLSEDPFWKVYSEEPLSWTVFAEKVAGGRSMTGKTMTGCSSVIRSYPLIKSRLPPSASDFDSAQFMVSEWPPTMTIRVNQRPMDMTKIRPSQKYKKTKDSFLDFTHVLDTPYFSIQLESTTPSKVSYLVVVQSMFPVAVEDLVERLSNDPAHNIPVDRSKEFIQRSFKNNDMILTQQVSLKDPLTMSRIAIPARGVSCTHWGCFDLTVYLTTNKNIRTWLCPRCDKPAPYSTLMIDRYFMECLRLFTEEDDLVIHPDCTITKKSDAPTPVVQKKLAENAIQIISLDSDDESDEHLWPPPRATPPPAPSAMPTTGTTTQTNPSLARRLEPIPPLAGSEDTASRHHSNLAAPSQSLPNPLRAGQSPSLHTHQNGPGLPPIQGPVQTPQIHLPELVPSGPVAAPSLPQQRAGAAPNIQYWTDARSAAPQVNRPSLPGPPQGHSQHMPQQPPNNQQTLNNQSPPPNQSGFIRVPVPTNPFSQMLTQTSMTGARPSTAPTNNAQNSHANNSSMIGLDPSLPPQSGRAISHLNHRSQPRAASPASSSTSNVPLAPAVGTVEHAASWLGGLSREMAAKLNEDSNEEHMLYASPPPVDRSAATHMDLLAAITSAGATVTPQVPNVGLPSHTTATPNTLPSSNYATKTTTTSTLQKDAAAAGSISGRTGQEGQISLESTSGTPGDLFLNAQTVPLELHIGSAPSSNTSTVQPLHPTAESRQTPADQSTVALSIPSSSGPSLASIVPTTAPSTTSPAPIAPTTAPAPVLLSRTKSKATGFGAFVLSLGAGKASSKTGATRDVPIVLDSDEE